MNPILLTVCLVAAIGLVGSLVLVFASKKLAVEEDERLADVLLAVFRRQEIARRVYRCEGRRKGRRQQAEGKKGFDESFHGK